MFGPDPAPDFNDELNQAGGKTVPNQGRESIYLIDIILVIPIKHLSPNSIKYLSEKRDQNFFTFV